MNKISLIATWYVKPDKMAQFESTICKYLENVSNEEGVIEYVIHNSRYDFGAYDSKGNLITSIPIPRPGTIVFYEKYSSWKAFETHVKGDNLKKFKEENKESFVLDSNGEPFIQVIFLKELP